MRKNAIGLLLMLAALIGSAGELCGWLVPTVSWPFTASRELGFLSCAGDLCPALAVEGRVHWFGWLSMLLLALPGLCLMLSRGKLRLPPEGRRRVQRFRSMRRGWWSLLVMALLLLLAAMDQTLVGKRALLVITTEGQWYMPALRRNMLPGSVFGLTGNAAHAEADYRALREQQGKPGGPRLVILPPVPWDATTDAAPFPTELLPEKGGRIYTPDGRQLFNGQACRLYPNGDVHLRIRYRKGVPDGHTQGWAPDRREVYSATWRGEERTRERLDSAEGGSVRDFLAGSADTLYLIHYHPSPPLKGGHLLGTDSQGTDIAALLFGGLQVNVKATLFYLPIIYGIGLTLGMLMGYWGGLFDLFTQRGIEIISQLPFLFIVMILTDFLPLDMRGMFTTLLLLALFGWMPMTYLIRTATMREKSRDYVAAARTMGAGPLHILRRHILPNLTSIIITLIPFSVAVVVLSLTSLDYLGFGLPDTYPSWGRLLNDGLAKLSSPWIASGAFGALTLTLLLITFIGEAVREAIDPKSGEHYK